MNNKDKRFGINHIGYVLLVLSALILLCFQCLINGKNLFLAVPTWSDELDYFREIFSFSENGFNFGGSLFAGYDAKLGPMGAHSFSPILVWGLFSLFSWNEHSILIFNLAFLTVSWIVFIALVRPKGKSLICILVLAYLFMPLYLYLPTSMIEVPLYAAIIIYFALFNKYMESDKKAIWFWLTILMGAYITGIRITYVVVLFPVILAKTDYKLNKRTIRNLAIYVVLFLIFYKIYNLFCADYPDWTTSKLSSADGVVGKLKVILWNVKDNIHKYFSIHNGSAAEVVLRYVYGIAIAIIGFSSLFEMPGKIKFKFNARLFSYFIMSGGLLTMMIFLYDIRDYRDFRTFSPILFFMVMLFGLHKTNDGLHKWLKRGLSTAVVCMMAVIFSVNLMDDRVVEKNTEAVEGFEVLDTEDEEGRPLILATTFDINWKDVGLMKSVPSKLGFQVFYKDLVEENNKKVAYILTTDIFVSDHPDIFENYDYICNIEAYGPLYKVR